MNKELKSKALYFLSRREYPYKELFQKLKKYTLNEEEIHEVLKDLQQNNYLSDERFITNFITSKSKRYGLIKIKHDLMQKTNDKELVESIISKSPISEFEIAKSLWERKFKSLKPKDKNELLKQIRFLQNKGFSYEIIKKIINLHE